MTGASHPGGKNSFLTADPGHQWCLQAEKEASICCKSSMQELSRNGSDKPWQWTLLWGSGSICPGGGGKNPSWSWTHGHQWCFGAARASSSHGPKRAQRSPGKGLNSVLQRKVKNPQESVPACPEGKNSFLTPELVISFPLSM